MFNASNVLLPKTARRMKEVAGESETILHFFPSHKIINITRM